MPFNHIIIIQDLHQSLD